MHLSNLKLALMAGTAIAICVFLWIAFGEYLDSTLNMATLVLISIFSIGLDVVTTIILFIGLSIETYVGPPWDEAVRNRRTK